MDLSVGAWAPAFCLPDGNGKKICLKDFSDKWVVLYFYPKDDTSGCTVEAIDFTAKNREFENLGAVVLGVSPDSGKSHCAFIEKHSLGIKLLSDENKEVLKKYGAWGKKMMYGKEFDGVTRSTFLISPEGKVAHAWPKVSVEGHAEEVLKKLEELK
ncbi:MAG: thioredoxin-dependent thiol peroxidase [Candidatus Diapherotrites archaeon]|nr:thioredoxin-dependent thiol peroxidase [Candidatus Diapherotrites archaeon]